MAILIGWKRKKLTRLCDVTIASAEWEGTCNGTNSHIITGTPECVDKNDGQNVATSEEI
jgi:hypothetical protein